MWQQFLLSKILVSNTPSHKNFRRFCTNFYGELKTVDMVNDSIVSQHLNAG